MAEPGRRDPGPLLLEGRGLALGLGGRRVVDGVSVALHPGEWVALIGPNGAGKSSLLSLLAALRAPEAGELSLLGQPLSQWPAAQRARRIAWLGQQGEAEGEIAARDVVRLGRVPHHGLLGSPTAQDEAAVDAAMAETECSAFAARPLSALSGGERQRVLLARALAVRAPILLLDEPTAHLDAPHQRALLQRMAAHAAGGGAAVLVLHDLSLALAADRVWLMESGRLVADARPDDQALHAAMGWVFGDALAIERAGGDGPFIARLKT